jgi:hypothetical protein
VPCHSAGPGKAWQPALKQGTLEVFAACKMNLNLQSMKWIAPYLFILLAWALLLLFVASILKIPYFIGVEAQFEQMPENDKELEDWLKSQREVAPDSVGVYRNGKTVQVWYRLSRNYWSKQPIPDLNLKCKSLGYIGHNAAFHDIPGE